MRVTNDHNTYAYQQQRTNTRHTGFADMLRSRGDEDSKNETAVNDTSTGIDVQKAYEEAVSQTAGARASVSGDDRLKDAANAFFDKSNEINGVDTTRKLNDDSNGDKVLTAEQIEQLSAKYDVKNLSPQERYDLFCDLTDMGILTSDEVKSIGIGKFIGVTVLRPTSEDDSSSWMEDISLSNLYEWMQAFINKEQEAYDYMISLGQKDNLDEHSQKAYNRFQNESAEIDSLMASHKKVADVLSQLVR